MEDGETESPNQRKTIEKVEIWKKVSQYFGNKYTIVVVLVVNLLNLISGFSFAWSSPILVQLNETQNNPLGRLITPDETSLIGSLFYIGAAIGPLLLLQISSTLGGKTALVVLSLPLPIAYAVLAVAKDIELYYVCRVVTGLVIGSTCSITPLYVSEIAPANIRGSLMSTSNTFIQTGILLTYVIGPYVSIMTFNLIIAAVSVIFLILFKLSCPESPYHIMRVKGKEEAKEILLRFRTGNIEEELNDIKESVTADIKNSSGEYKIKETVKPFMMATTLLVVQQFTGINIVIGYSQLIFLETNIRISSATCSIVVGSLQLASSFIVPVLSETFPRKLMLCFSLLGLVVCNFAISLYFAVYEGTGYANWLPLTTLICFVVVDNCGNGPIPWVLLGEIYPINLRPAGPAVSTTVYYLMQFLLMFIFNKIAPKYLFFAFAWCSIIGIIFVRYFITETRGRTLRDIGGELEEVVPLKRTS